MKLFLVVIISLYSNICSYALGPGNTTPAGLSSLGQMFWNAQGTFSSSKLPKWCVNTHTSNSTGAIPVATNVLLTQQIGATCIRADATNWDQVETGSTGNFVWTNSDAFWNTVCAAGINPIFIATYNNNLYSGQSTVFYTIAGNTNINGYANYATKSVQRLIGINNCLNVIAELYNEPNLTVFTTTTWAGSAYGSVAATTATSILAAEPNAKVIFGGLSPGTGTPSSQFVNGIVGAGVSLSNISYFTVHPYNYNEGTPSLTPSCEQIGLDTQLFQLMSAANAGGIINNQSTVITEYGMPLQGLSNSPTTVLNAQAICIAKAMLTSVAIGIPLFAQYDLIDDGTNYSSSDQYTFGLFYNGSASSGNPIIGATPYGIKPSGTAFTSITQAAANSISYSVSFNPNTSITAIEFNKPSGISLVLWTFASGTQAYSASIGNFSSITCKDVLGNTQSCTYSNGNLSMNLTANEGPVIVTANY